MPEPIIASLTDPEAGMVEHLMQAQLLINERDVYARALDLACEEHTFTRCLAGHWLMLARKQLESEKIDSGKVA
jgi:hypothetical protein